MKVSAQRKPRPQVSLTNRAYYTIRERILRGALQPGVALSRRMLAEELGMSFLPISEALRQLEHDGLLESKSRAGTRVRMPTTDEVRGRYVVREALEAASAKLCCERATFKERLELQRMADQLDTLYAILYARWLSGQNDSDFMYVVHQHHASLHLKIAEYARCPELAEAIEKNQVLIYNWFYDVASQRRSLPQDFHAKLIGTIIDDHSEAADKTMRAHVRYGLESLLQTIESRTETGDWRVKREHLHN